MTLNRDARWPADLWQRARHLFPLKLFGITAVITLFFVGYFHVLRHPAHPVTIMPTTALDALIPFQPWTLGAYLSLWLYVGFAPGLQLTLAQLRVYAVWSIALCLTGLGIFYFWPTAVPPVEIADPSSGAFQMLRGVDASGNACPSMHVAFAVFTAFWLARVLKEARVPFALHLVNIAWVLAITWSTVAIRQHVVLDVVAGALLGSAYAWLSLRRLPVGRVNPAQSIDSPLPAAPALRPGPGR
ncbi:phosphatase PAP2 family protein [Ideonella sp. YS5]|uniref:phosphatase PAP2 family protein n=1 Tax=Ideonella sp. YS5 TaxID=3453714 RepID=UPI003EE8DF0C